MAGENQEVEKPVGGEEKPAGGADGAPEIEIEIEGEGAPEGGEAPAPATAAAKPQDGDGDVTEEDPEGQPVRQRGPHKRRPASFYQQKLQAEASERQRLATENEELKRAMSAQATKLTEADAVNMTQYAARIAAELATAERETEEAISSGDPKAIAAANRKLAMKASEQGNIDAWRANQPKADAPKPAERQAEPPRPADRQEMRPVANPVRDAWISSNPWFDNGSQDFDPEMQTEAVSYAQIVERRLIRQGRAEDVGKKAYFEEINKHMTQEFPDVFQNTTRMPRMTAGANGIAPPVRGGPGNGGGGSGSIKVRLTAEQRDFAINNARNGAVKGPNGERLTDEQAVVRFARKLHEDQQANRKAG
jgi:hypothetical protein